MIDHPASSGTRSSRGGGGNQPGALYTGLIVIGVIGLVLFLLPRLRGEVSLDVMRSGTCFDLGAGAEEISGARPADCEDLHTYQFAGNAPMVAVGSFPGATEMERLALEFCLEPFEEFVGVAAQRSEWALYVLRPTEDAWTAGYRRASCLVGLPSGEQWVGSAESSDR